MTVGSGHPIGITGADVDGTTEEIRSASSPSGASSYSLGSSYAYVRLRSVSEGGERFWEVIDAS